MKIGKKTPKKLRSGVCVVCFLSPRDINPPPAQQSSEEIECIFYYWVLDVKMKPASE